MYCDLLLERQTKKPISEEALVSQLLEIASAADVDRAGFAGRLGEATQQERGRDPETQDNIYRYRATLRVERVREIRNPAVARDNLQKVVNLVRKRAEKRRWSVTEAPTSRRSTVTATAVSLLATSRPKTQKKAVFEVPDLTPQVLERYFSDIYERDQHIRIIHAAVRTTIESKGKILGHTLLEGNTGAAKTVICERFKAWFDDVYGGEAVQIVDGTTMTKAGLERWLLELADADLLPHVLVVDELEKQNMDNLLCLNAVMGSGLLTRLNAMIGHKREQARLVVIGICNDLNELLRFRSGALYSRFGHELHCARPSRELSLRVLLDKVKSLPGGNPAWAEEALSFGWDVLGQRDIRKIEVHLGGKDDLLDGSWQADRLAVLQTKLAEEVREREGKLVERNAASASPAHVLAS